MEDKTLLLQFLGENPTLKIIDFFLDNRTDYSKKEIIEATGMSKTTFYKVWKILEKFEVVSPTRRYGRAQLFKINENSDIVKKLMILDFTLIKHTMKKQCR
jgi:DNA-binding transcriptional regulator GbsR (MarR family)